MADTDFTASIPRRVAANTKGPHLPRLQPDRTESWLQPEARHFIDETAKMKRPIMHKPAPAEPHTALVETSDQRRQARLLRSREGSPGSGRFETAALRLRSVVTRVAAMMAEAVSKATSRRASALSHAGQVRPVLRQASILPNRIQHQ